MESKLIYIETENGDVVEFMQHYVKNEQGGLVPVNVLAGKVVSKKSLEQQKPPAPNILAMPARTSLLDLTDWLVTRHNEQTRGTSGKEMGALVASNQALSAAQFKELFNYRQALRDMPAGSDAFPVQPAWLVALLAKHS